MANIIKYNSVTIDSIMANLEQYKHNPSAIQRSMYDLLGEITGGTLNIVDPTNPFVFLLEASAVNTALAINENMINLRKQYPNLAQNESDLYHHMSDVDFINRFSKPTTAGFVYTLQLNELKNNLVYDSSIDANRGTIPRDTTITVDGNTYSLQYPIDIVLYSTGVLVIKYDASIVSPLETLSTNIIEYKVKKDSNGIEWIYFTVPMTQMSVKTSYYPVQLSTTFTQTIRFDDKYYYCRVWTKDGTNSWVEIKTTHTDQVYDPFVATAILKVVDDTLNVTIPSIYTDNGLISSNVRIDVYSTKGQMTLNLSNYNIDAFISNYVAIDEERDLSVYTSVINTLTIFAFSAELVDGGSDGLSFDELRNRVINNSLGANNLPITNSQLVSNIEDSGFTLVKDIDTVTNRVFLATRSLPKPLNDKLVTSSNMSMIPFITDVGVLSNLSTVMTNADSQTLLSNNFFEFNNGKLTLLDDAANAALASLNKADLVLLVNSRTYLFNPFYYVLDYSSDEFKVRSYHLDQPSVSNISFLAQNQTLQLIVNTSTYDVKKVSDGYILTIITKSDNFYKQLNDSEVSTQISFSIDSSTKGYINGTLVGRDSSNERIFEFHLVTNYHMDSNDLITITNSNVFNTNQIDVSIPLSLEVDIFHNTTSITNEFISTPEDVLLGSFMLPTNTKNVTHETVQLVLGYSLSNLWKRSRIIPSGLEYIKHTTDVPMTHDAIVYDVDPVTNSIFSVDINNNLTYNVLHNIGDPVLDVNGNPILVHKAGDPVLDVNGDPVPDTSLSSSKELDLLLIDGKYLIADEGNYINYRNEVSDTIRSWVVNDLNDIQDRLLEQTRIFFYPKNKIGIVDVYPDNLGITSTTAEQSFTIDLYVNNSIFTDITIRELLTNNTTVVVSDYLANNTTIVMSDLIELLRVMYGSSVVSFTMLGLGGVSNYSLVRVINSKDNISLRKKLVLQQDNSIIVTEDINVVFHEII